MGEIAEMMLDGTLDAITGEYIGEPCGYPRTYERVPKDSPYTHIRKGNRTKKFNKPKVRKMRDRY